MISNKNNKQKLVETYAVGRLNDTVTVPAEEFLVTERLKLEVLIKSLSRKREVKGGRDREEKWGLYWVVEYAIGRNESLWVVAIKRKRKRKLENLKRN